MISGKILNQYFVLRCCRQLGSGSRFIRALLAYVQSFVVRAQHACYTLPQAGRPGSSLVLFEIFLQIRDSFEKHLQCILFAPCSACAVRLLFDAIGSRDRVRGSFDSRFAYKFESRLLGGTKQCMHSIPAIRCRQQRRSGLKFVDVRLAYKSAISHTMLQAAWTRFETPSIRDLFIN